MVYKAQHLKTGEIVAIKKVKFEEDGVPSTAIREISLLKNLKHPNVVELKEAIFEGDRLYLVFEYLEYDLKKFMRKKGTALSPQQTQSFMYQILHALKYLHSNRMFHRDLKPQNLLVSEDGKTIKLADFGLARAFGFPIKTYTHEVVTLWYRCPEILLSQKHYSLGVDLWSVGCIFAEMAQRRPLFMGDSEIDQVFKIFKIQGTPNEHNWPDALKLNDMKSTFPKFKGIPMEKHTPTLNETEVNLLKGLVALDPSNRISAQMALLHPYFDTLDKSQYPYEQEEF